MMPDLPSAFFVIPSSFFVIPAKAGTHPLPVRVDAASDGAPLSRD
jgi:hypothetical protein